MPKLNLFINGAVFECEGSEALIMAERTKFLSLLRSDAEPTAPAENPPVCGVTKNTAVDLPWDVILPALKNRRIMLDVGDIVTTTLTDGRVVDFVVTADEGATLRFESRDCLGEYVQRGKVDTYFDKVYAAMPEALQAAIIKTERLFLDKSGVKCTESRKLFLPSAAEIFPEEECLGDKGLYEQMEWYKDCHNRIRGFNRGAGTSDWYWTSSRYSGSTTSWCLVSYYGSASSDYASNTTIAAPVCFRISKS